jgi:DNA-binding phage protein
MPKARPFDAAKYRDDPRAIAKYLNDALSTGDPVHITKAIGDMVRSRRDEVRAEGRDASRYSLQDI